MNYLLHERVAEKSSLKVISAKTRAPPTIIHVRVVANEQLVKCWHVQARNSFHFNLKSVAWSLQVKIYSTFYSAQKTVLPAFHVRNMNTLLTIITFRRRRKCVKLGTPLHVPRLNPVSASGLTWMFTDASA